MMRKRSIDRYILRLLLFWCSFIASVDSDVQWWARDFFAVSFNYFASSTLLFITHMHIQCSSRSFPVTTGVFYLSFDIILYLFPVFKHFFAILLLPRCLLFNAMFLNKILPSTRKCSSLQPTRISLSGMEWKEIYLNKCLKSVHKRKRGIKSWSHFRFHL